MYGTGSNENGTLRVKHGEKRWSRMYAELTKARRQMRVSQNKLGILGYGRASPERGGTECAAVE